MDLDIQHYDDYRDYLSDIFAIKCRSNPRFGLRNMAQQLDVSPATLSGVLNRKKGLSRPKALQISARLRMPKSQQHVFALMVDKEHARSVAVRHLSKRKLDLLKSQTRKSNQIEGVDYEQIHQDTLDAISHWYYWVILEMISSAPCGDIVNLALRLDLPLSTVRNALKTLSRLGMIERTESGHYQRLGKEITTSADIPSASIRQLHSQLLDRAKAALTSQPVEQRDYSAMILKVDEAAIPEIKQEIEAFRLKLASKMNCNNGKEIYGMTIQFFNLLNKEY